MRDIKFRAWDKDLSEMHCGAFSVDGGGFGIIDAGWKKWSNEHGKAIGGKNCELMQYTGLLDKEGKEIYEGDIIDVRVVTGAIYLDLRNSEPLEEYVGAVVFSDGSYMITRRTTTPCDLPDEIYQPHDDLYRRTHFVGSSVEIIGNIYENLELLEVNNDNQV